MLCEIDNSFSASAGDFEADKGGLDRPRFWKQFQRGRGDDAERALGADEKVAQVVTGVVLFQLRQQVQDTAIRQHHFEPQRHFARHAIGERAGAAGIGGEIAADGAASFGAERQREQPVGLGGFLLGDLQHHAGFAGHGVGGRIDLADLVQPPQRNHHLAMMRGLPADQPGIAALRHQRDLVFGGELADRGDFRGRARAQHQRRAAMEQAALLGEVGRDIGGIRHRVFVADDIAESCDQFGRKRRGGGLNEIHGRVSSYFALLFRDFRPGRSRHGATGH